MHYVYVHQLLYFISYMLINFIQIQRAPIISDFTRTQCSRLRQPAAIVEKLEILNLNATERNAPFGELRRS